MEYANTLSQIIPRNNGNTKGLIFVQGRMAFIKGESIFDCPFELGSDSESIWMNGFQTAEKNGK